MINFSCTNENYRNDLMELVRAFEQRTDEDVSLFTEYVSKEGEFEVRLTSDKFPMFSKIYRFPFSYSDETEKRGWKNDF